MFDFRNYIVTVAGASLIVSLLELVLPIGKMKEFTKSIINVLYMYIVISPVVEYIKLII